MSQLTNNVKITQEPGNQNFNENQYQTIINQFINNYRPIKNRGYIDSEKKNGNIRMICININGFGLS